ncbi:hypothetical protein [Tenacibaculum sp.]|uniref:hypothetical protein n=1 Tax=Tenacibaculum sp. TaxID=1906242 RepID=UPI003D0A9D5F
MIGYRHVLNSIGNLFTQLLSSLNVINGTPIGMIDEINNNNAIYFSANSYKGDLNGYLKSTELTNDDLHNGFVLEFYYYSDTANGASIYCDRRLNNNTRRFQVQCSNSSTSITLIGATAPVYTKMFVNDTSNRWRFVRITYTPTTLLKIEVEDETDFIDNSPIQINGNGTDFTKVTVNARLIDAAENVSNKAEGALCGIRLSNTSGLLAYWPLSETYESNGDIAYDCSSNNLDMALYGNIGTSNTYLQDVLFDFQRGFLNNVRKVPILLDLSAFADGSLLTDINAILNDGFMFLNSGNTIKNADVAELKAKDIYNLWYDIGGNPKNVTFAEIETAIATYPDVYGGDVVSGESIKNISLK